MVIEQRKINRLLTEIEKHEKITLFVHENPDCDAIGSAYAFKLFIEINFPKKDVRIAGLSNIDKSFLFPFFDIQYKEVDKNFVQNSIGIIFDVSNQSRILTQLNVFCKWNFLLDHHQQPENVANIQIVIPNCSSTCELVGSIFMKLSKRKFQISAQIANSLYFGILTDTNRFLYQYVNENTFKLMQFLCKNGLNREFVHDQLYIRKLEDIELDNKLYQLIDFNPSKGYATLFIDQKYNKKYNQKSFNGKVYLMANIENIDIWTLVYYDENLKKWKGSIRSRTFDVSQIARKFNGGGHKLASGFCLNNFKETKFLEEEIIQFLDNVKK